MTHKFVCEICDQNPLPSDERICGDKRCRRSKQRAKLYHERRQTPNCDWCNEPILEPLKRRYHEECRADKNRLRVQAYNETHKPTPGPKKSRCFKDRITCMICRKRVRRTGGRQVICKAPECEAARQSQIKREARVRRREIEQILVLKRARDAQRQPPRRDETEVRGDMLLRRIVI